MAQKGQQVEKYRSKLAKREKEKEEKKGERRKRKKEKRREKKRNKNIRSRSQFILSFQAGFDSIPLFSFTLFKCFENHGNYHKD